MTSTRTAAAMTTESQQDTRRGVSPLLGAAAAGAVVTVLLALVGWFGAQSAGLWGALAGGSLALVVLLASTTVVDVVAGVMPGASLLIALLTFFLQILLLVAVAISLQDSSLLDGQVSRGWFAGALMGVTLAWLPAHAWLYTRLRIPAYDLHAAGRPGSES